MLDEEEGINKAERLFMKYKDVMFGAAFSILNDTHLADDAVSQSFAKLLKNIDKIVFPKIFGKYSDKIDEDNEKKTSSYMTVVCKNIAINMVRKNIYLNIDDSMIERIEDKQNLNNTDPALIVQERESFNLLIEYIKSMDKRYTEVIVLKYYYDMENCKIAEILEIKESTVRKRLARGKEILMKMLKNSGEYEI